MAVGVQLWLHATNVALVGFPTVRRCCASPTNYFVRWVGESEECASHAGKPAPARASACLG
eukprot:9468290-Pyramimonas_sp.AAC.1